MTNESETKQLVVEVFGKKNLFFMYITLIAVSFCSIPVGLFSSLTASEFLSVHPEFKEYESADLDEVREFKSQITSFPSAQVTWLKDGKPLSDVTAEISISLRQISETR